MSEREVLLLARQLHKIYCEPLGFARAPLDGSNCQGYVGDGGCLARAATILPAVLRRHRKGANR